MSDEDDERFNKCWEIFEQHQKAWERITAAQERGECVDAATRDELYALAALYKKVRSGASTQ